jgi:hypothetical protein
MLTQEFVRSLFDYDPEGYLVWREDRNNNKVKGLRAGCLNGKGYFKVRVNGKKHYVHRLIYLWHTGLLPELVDHVNGTSHDNRIENLRAATRSQNKRNSVKHKSLTSRWKGVCWITRNKKWQATIRKNGKYIYIGLFASEIDAALAYNKAATELFGEFANLNVLETLVES